jgi:hypothetical protein
LRLEQFLCIPARESNRRRQENNALFNNFKLEIDCLISEKRSRQSTQQYLPQEGSLGKLPATKRIEDFPVSTMWPCLRVFPGAGSHLLACRPRPAARTIRHLSPIQFKTPKKNLSHSHFFSKCNGFVTGRMLNSPLLITRDMKRR